VLISHPTEGRRLSLKAHEASVKKLTYYVSQCYTAQPGIAVEKAGRTKLELVPLIVVVVVCRVRGTAVRWR